MKSKDCRYGTQKCSRQFVREKLGAVTQFFSVVEYSPARRSSRPFLSLSFSSHSPPKRHFLQTETADLPQFSISPVLHIYWNICVQAKHRGHSEHYVCRALELQALISVWCMYAVPKTINTCDSLWLYTVVDLRGVEG